MAAILGTLCEGTTGDVVRGGNSSLEKDNGVVHSTQYAILRAVHL
jgi:hypothetical protein